MLMVSPPTVCLGDLIPASASRQFIILSDADVTMAHR